MHRGERAWLPGRAREKVGAVLRSDDEGGWNDDVERRRSDEEVLAEPTGERSAEVPPDAVGVDLPCPHCGRRPIASAATGYRLTGMVFAYRAEKTRILGCQPCIRRTLLGGAGRNLLVGWWTTIAFFLNPLAIAWNVGRAFVDRGPNEHLVDALRESGVRYEFLADDEWDPDADHRVLAAGDVVELVAATAAAGESTDVEAVAHLVAERFPDADRSEIRDRLAERPGAAVDVAEASAALGTVLTDERKERLAALLVDVARADGGLDVGELHVLSEVADGLDLPDDRMRELVWGT